MPIRNDPSPRLPTQLPKPTQAKTMARSKNTNAQAQIAKASAATAASTPSAASATDTPLDDYNHALAGALPSTPLGDVTLATVAGDFSFPDAPAGSTITSNTHQATFKTVGDTATTGVAFGQVTAEESHYAQWKPGGVQADVKGDAKAMAVTAHAQQDWATKHGHGQITAEETLDIGATAAAEAGVLVDVKGEEVVLHAEADVMVGEDASVTVKEVLGKHFSATGTTGVKTGTWGSADATLDFEPKKGTAMVKAGASYFAGAEEKAQGELHGGWLRLSGGVGAQQGVGGGLQFGTGIEEGRLKADLDVSAAVGCGATVTCGVSFNAKAMAKKAQAGFQAVQKSFQRSAQTTKTLPAGSAKASVGSSPRSTAKSFTKASNTTSAPAPEVKRKTEK